MRHGFMGMTITFVGLLASPAAADVRHTTDSVETIREALADGSAVLIDVREKQEWDSGRIEGAKSMPLSRLILEERAKEMTRDLDKDTIVYTYCARGRRSLIAAGILKELGYDVRALEQGYEALLESGFEKSKD